MKPDWDRLMGDFANSDSALVADVDCTAAGQSLCQKSGVRGYPTVKYGDPADLQDYQGGRDYAALKKFADENLKPMCSPTNIDLCDDDKKAQIEQIQAMSDADLQSSISQKEQELKEAESTFETEVAKLQSAYQQLQTTKDQTLEQIKNSGLGLMKAVQAAKAKASSGDAEL
jgi:hypothetical protein